MKILICDDDQNFMEDLRGEVRQKLPSDTQIECCRNRKELFNWLLEDQSIDLLLMDICLEEESGISLARELLERYPGIDVIFITGYPEMYYENVFLNVRPYGFLRKPVKEELLVSLICKYYRERKTFYCFFKTQNGLEKIRFSDIYYIESQKHKLLIHLKEDILETYGRLSELAVFFPKYFLHCHKSFLVNARMIKSYDGESFLLENKEKIRISQLRQKEIRKEFMQFLDDENLFV